MDGDLSLARFETWHGAETDVLAGVQRVTAHPGFAAASRALASGMLDLAGSDRALDAIFKDAGRYAATMWAFALHEDGGLTLPRLKAVCARSGLLSAGRVRTLLQFLEHFGYVQKQPGPLRGALYIPSAAFRAAWDRQFVVALQAARQIAPEIGILLEGAWLDERHAYGRIHAAGMLAAMQEEPQVSALLRVFLHPYAGSHLLWTLIATCADLEFPPRRCGPVSIAGLARTCGVSRVQVARIFHEAACERLATLDSDGMVHFHDGAHEQLRFFYAIQFVQILAAAAQAVHLRELDQICAVAARNEEAAS